MNKKTDPTASLCTVRSVTNWYHQAYHINISDLPQLASQEPLEGEVDQSSKQLVTVGKCAITKISVESWSWIMKYATSRILTNMLKGKWRKKLSKKKKMESSAMFNNEN